MHYVGDTKILWGDQIRCTIYNPNSISLWLSFLISETLNLFKVLNNKVDNIETSTDNVYFHCVICDVIVNQLNDYVS